MRLATQLLQQLALVLLTRVSKRLSKTALVSIVWGRGRRDDAKRILPKRGAPSAKRHESNLWSRGKIIGRGIEKAMQYSGAWGPQLDATTAS